jgi:hypothetical protein
VTLTALVPDAGVVLSETLDDDVATFSFNVGILILPALG